MHDDVQAVSRPAERHDAVTLAPPAGHPKFPLLDGQRAIAALLVVGYHVAFISGSLTRGWTSWWTGHLNVGVTVFFGISGFLLYRPFLAARHGAPPRSVRGYLRNRALRIAPGYWVAITLAAIYPGLEGVFTGDWPWFYGFAQVYSTKRQLLGLPVAWTLGVEVSFYLLLPLYSLVLKRLTRGRPGWARIELGALVVLCVLTTALQGTPPFIHLSTIVATFDWFAIGMAIAVVSVRGPGPVLRAVADRPAACWLAAIGVYLAMCQWMVPIIVHLHLHQWGVQELVNVFYGTVAALWLLPAILSHQTRGVPQRVLRTRTLGWLGLISYGIYLYHLPLLEAIQRLGFQSVLPGQLALSYAVLVLPATIIIAAASYYVIERPALGLKSIRPGGLGESKRAGAPPGSDQPADEVDGRGNRDVLAGRGA